MTTSKMSGEIETAVLLNAIWKDVLRIHSNVQRCQCFLNDIVELEELGLDSKRLTLS